MEGKELYGIDIKTNRYVAYMKHAFILNKEHGTNIALMTTGSMHQEDALYGHKTYYVNEKTCMHHSCLSTTSTSSTTSQQV